MSERELFIQNYIKYVNNQADFTILNETENTFHDDSVDEAWVMWQLSANRQGYKLVPVCKHEWSIQLSGGYICDLCGEFNEFVKP